MEGGAGGGCGGKSGKVGALTRGVRSEVSIVGTNHITGLHIAAVKKVRFQMASRQLNYGLCVSVCACVFVRVKKKIFCFFWQSNTNTDRQLYFCLISFQHKQTHQNTATHFASAHTHTQKRTHRHTHTGTSRRNHTGTKNHLSYSVTFNP